jgi:hypothetical protein
VKEQNKYAFVVHPSHDSPDTKLAQSICSGILCSQDKKKKTVGGAVFIII